ncbi:hypothetical protein GF319_12480 [Candidatus Bathyarchaeota archaeon]|nr:hypothetical protein [Candidatus Bathyarchaeota archaeon]
MTTFFHFSDFHIPPEKSISRKEGNPCNKIERVIELAKDTNIKPAFSLITGDISQDGSIPGYQIAQEYISQLESLGGPVLPVMGNVDKKGGFRECLLKDQDSDKSISCYYATIIEGIRVIALDSQSPGKHTGYLDEDQIDWLSKELKEEYEPTLIALHHPPFALHIPNGEKHLVFDESAMSRFQEVVRGSNVLAVLCGHLHQSLFVEDKGIQYLVGCAALSELHIEMNRYNIYDSYGFTQVTLNKNQINARPIIYNNGRNLISSRGI